MKTSIILTTTEAGTGKKRKRSFSDINPDATNEELKNFAVAFNGLTTNNYVETNRVDTTNVDTEGSHKQFRRVQITNAVQGETATITFRTAADETINPAVFFYSNGSIQILQTTAAESDDQDVAKFTINVPSTSGEIYLGILEKPDFYSEFTHASVT